MIIPRTEDADKLFGKTLQSFEPYLLANKRTKKPIIHISLNPSLEDILDEARLIAVSNEYMEKLGYGDQPYIAYEHTDIDRKHLHIASLNINAAGNKLDDGYQKLKSMAIYRDIEIKFGLKQISDEKNEEFRLFVKKVDYMHGDIKRQISNITKALTDEYHFQSLGEYSALLSVFNINVKHVRGEDSSNLFNGIIYNATTDKGELVGNPIKSSSIGKSVGYDALNWKMKKTTEKIKEGKVNLKKSIHIISDAKTHSTTREHFESILKSKNIDTVFRRNEEGRIYGVTFIDHNNKSVYNGSRLGKEFSANVFNQHFDINTVQSDTQELFRESESQTSLNEVEDLSYSRPVSVDEIFGSFYFHSGRESQYNVVKKKKKSKKRIK